MTWIETTDGMVNAAFVVRIEHTASGTLLHLTTGETVRTTVTLEVVTGELVVIPPVDDDSDDSCPF